MILDFNTLSSKYNFNIKGIIHIGGHYGQEYDMYKNLNVPILFFEPLSNNFQHLQNKVKGDPNVITYQCALGNENKLVTMNVEVANQGQSSSILKPKNHLNIHPWCTFEEKLFIKCFFTFIRIAYILSLQSCDMFHCTIIKCKNFFSFIR